MKRGLVFGKFLPFHKGHKALVRFALKYCDELIVLVCGSDKEEISTEVRVKWVKSTFRKNNRIIVRAFDYKESELPNTSEYSRVVSQLWASKFKETLPFFDVLISFEKYGKYVAEYLDVRFITFDRTRSKHSISSAMIRQNPFKHWNYIMKSAKPYFQRKVVLLGTESTGKTTLCNTLARYFEANLVVEGGKKTIGNLADFTKKDLEVIIEQHSEKIEASQKDARPLVVIETDIHIIQSYSKYTFGEYIDIDKSTVELHKADLYLYLNNDVPFIQNGRLMSEKTRNELDKSHRQTLKDFGVNYHEIKGNWSQRLNTAIGLIETMMTKY